MKRLLCMMLALLVLLGTVCLPCASAAEGQWALFGEAINRLRWSAPFWDVPVGAPFPVASVMDYVRQQLCIDDYGREPITSGGLSYYAYYAIPAEVFEAAAADAFAIVDVAALRSYTSFFWDHLHFTGIDNFQNYQPEEEVYLFSSYGAMGDDNWYEVLGYTEADGLYTVYARFLVPAADATFQEDSPAYIRTEDGQYITSHYLRTAMTISNGQPQFHSWEEITELPEEVMTVPVTVLSPDDRISVQSAPGVFPAGTVITIREPEQGDLKAIRQALAGLAEDFAAYHITATAQLDGQAVLTFPIPKDLDADALALFSISEEGVARQLEITVDKAAGTVTAAVDYFGLFALAQVSKRSTLTGDVNEDGQLNARDARLLLRYVAGLAGAEDLALDAADFNGDGRVNARDVRALLRKIAGLTEADA